MQDQYRYSSTERVWVEQQAASGRRTPGEHTALSLFRQLAPVVQVGSAAGWDYSFAGLLESCLFRKICRLYSTLIISKLGRASHP